MIERINTVDTAKLIRKALKESFPGVKFSVRSEKYAGGSSVHVNWTDGPNEKQVNAVAKVFEGSYFDGMTDYKGSLRQMMDSKEVRFGPDFVFVSREHSRDMVAKAIESVYRKYRADFEASGIDKPTVEDYENGRLLSVQFGFQTMPWQDLAWLISDTMRKMSDRMAGKRSQTAGRVTFLGNDGYSQVGALVHE